jgi:hypothetical protein
MPVVSGAMGDELLICSTVFPAGSVVGIVSAKVAQGSATTVVETISPYTKACKRVMVVPLL